MLARHSKPSSLWIGGGQQALRLYHGQNMAPATADADRCADDAAMHDRGGHNQSRLAQTERIEHSFVSGRRRNGGPATGLHRRAACRPGAPLYRLKWRYGVAPHR
jgi:hypothetical protein